MIMTSVFLLSLLTQAEPSSLERWLENSLARNAQLKSKWDQCLASNWRDPGLRYQLLSMDLPAEEQMTLRLAVGRELARRQLADEAVELLKPLPSVSCIDKAALHFYRGGALQAIGSYEEALVEFSTLEKLSDAPKRFLKTARLLRDRLTKLDPTKLPGIAQDMREIRRRLQVGKPDQRTVHLQKDVLNRLDKLIKETENQCKECQAGGSAQPNKPAEQSKPLPAQGKGEVADGRKFKDFSKWGDLPPKDREKVLQNLGKDLPANYRDAVEVYFRKLADEAGGDAP
jgi:tetratricopeptide (TPR) repeat protein